MNQPVEWKVRGVFFASLIWIFIFHHQELAKAAEALEFLLFGRVGSSS